MRTERLSATDIRKLLAHAQAIQAILNPPPRVEPAPEGTAARFLREATTPDHDGEVHTRNLHRVYETWCGRLDYTPLPIRRFNRLLPGPIRKSNGSQYAAGLRLEGHTHAAEAAIAHHRLIPARP